MRILFLTQVLPYPPDAGPRIKTWHVLRYLAERGDEIVLASFVRPEEQKHLPVLQELCTEVYPIPTRRSRIKDALYFVKSLFTGRPFLVERDDIPAMRKLINQLLKDQEFELIHADQISMAQFAGQPQPGSHTPRRIFDAHNATWVLLERVAEGLPWYARGIVQMEARRMKRYEGQLIQSFDQTLAVTEIDRQALLQAAENHTVSPHQEINKLQVIPIAVDTQQLAPVQRKPDSFNILTLGTLHYPPNADGIRWFMREVFPLVQSFVPEATLTVVGKNPPKDFFQFAEAAAGKITITGYVPELEPYLQKAALTVVPVLAGGGMRVRILEAFSRAMPVVTTTIGLEGIDAQPGKDVLVADQAKDFAQAVIQLLNDPTLQEQLAQNGRDLAIQHYDWQVVFRKIETLYNQLQHQSDPGSKEFQGTQVTG